MGLKRPIRGGGSLPPWAMRQGRGPLPLGRRTTPPWWDKSHIGEGWRLPPSFADIRRGRGALFFTTLKFSLPPFSFLEWTPLVWSLYLVGDISTIRTPSCCWNRDPNPSSFRCSTGSEPGGTLGILYVYNPARHYTCGATSSSWPYCEVFIDNVPTGM